MLFQIHLLRLGRKYKPKFDIILYHNFRLKAKLGVVYPLKQFNINSKQVKMVSLNMEKIHFWVQRGVILPKWLQSFYLLLYTPSLYQAGLVIQAPSFSAGLVNGKTIYSGKSYKSWSKNPNKASPRFFPFFKGKYVIRHWLRLKNIIKNEKNSTS
jgi:ribosomal protein S16